MREVATLPDHRPVPAKGTRSPRYRLARRGNQLVYRQGRHGLTAKSANEVRKRLEPLMRKSPPTAKPLIKKDTVWVEPTVEADVEFRDITTTACCDMPASRD